MKKPELCQRILFRGFLDRTMFYAYNPTYALRQVIAQIVRWNGEGSKVDERSDGEHRIRLARNVYDAQSRDPHVAHFGHFIENVLG